MGGGQVAVRLQLRNIRASGIARWMEGAYGAGGAMLNGPARPVELRPPDDTPAGRLRHQLAEARAVRMLAEATGDEQAWLEKLRTEFPRIVAYLRKHRGVEFRGRVLEIGAGACAFSAELSKLPQVVEVVATDVSRRLLEELAPRVFAGLGARADKIVRVTADYHRLGFPDESFDFVVCSATLHEAVDLVGVLREVRRVLKPGGRLVAVREPRPGRWSRGRLDWSSSGGVARRLRPYTRAEYEAFFRAAGLRLLEKPSWSGGTWRAYVNGLWEGITRNAFVFVAERPPVRMGIRRNPAPGRRG